MTESRSWREECARRLFQRRLLRAVSRSFRVPRRRLMLNGPRRLRIDGHAYRRRQRARARRKR